MNNKRQTRSFIIAVLIVAVVGATIGYAALATNLYINGTAGVATDTSWLIEFTDAKVNSKSTGVVNNSLTYEGGTTFKFDVALSAPSDSITYDVTVKNNGTIDAILNSISGLDEINAAQPTQIQYSISGISENDILRAGESKNFQVTVTWVADTDIPTGTLSKTSNITLNYVQYVNE